jgi:hypothetical protein
MNDGEGAFENHPLLGPDAPGNEGEPSETKMTKEQIRDMLKKENDGKDPDQGTVDEVFKELSRGAAGMPGGSGEGLPFPFG